MDADNGGQDDAVSRRNYLKVLGAVGATAGLGGCAGIGEQEHYAGNTKLDRMPEKNEAFTEFPGKIYSEKVGELYNDPGKYEGDLMAFASLDNVDFEGEKRVERPEWYESAGFDLGELLGGDVTVREYELSKDDESKTLPASFFPGKAKKSLDHDFAERFPPEDMDFYRAQDVDTTVVGSWLPVRNEQDGILGYLDGDLKNYRLVLEAVA